MSPLTWAKKHYPLKVKHHPKASSFFPVKTHQFSLTPRALLNTGPWPNNCTFLLVVYKKQFLFICFLSSLSVFCWCFLTLCWSNRSIKLKPFKTTTKSNWQHNLYDSLWVKSPRLNWSFFWHITLLYVYQLNVMFQAYNQETLSHHTVTLQTWQASAVSVRQIQWVSFKVTVILG